MAFYQYAADRIMRELGIQTIGGMLTRHERDQRSKMFEAESLVRPSVIVAPRLRVSTTCKSLTQLDTFGLGLRVASWMLTRRSQHSLLDFACNLQRGHQPPRLLCCWVQKRNKPSKRHWPGCVKNGLRVHWTLMTPCAYALSYDHIACVCKEARCLKPHCWACST